MTRQKEDIENRRSEVARQYLQGTYQCDIAVAVGVSVPTIERDLRVIRDRWIKSAIRDFDQIRAEQLAKLDLIESQLWEQWQRSCETIIKTRKEKREATKFPGTNNTIEKIEQSGDPRYMMGILNIIERRCKLMGLDAPTKVAPTDPSGTKPYDGLTDNDAAQRIAALLDQARTRRDRADPIE
ncbi:hypothetical protein [Neptunomonas phycophila]|uniref:hypothetical protein n=1 Tax=Neptunomonas TaxID=75687 RepID=UPI0026E3286E|nr:hypothetical protein [Neptunomonas phycophila]MDO6466793.1 hypothetical protein [Neptunomonas phycophila]